MIVNRNYFSLGDRALEIFSEDRKYKTNKLRDEFIISLMISNYFDKQLNILSKAWISYVSQSL